MRFAVVGCGVIGKVHAAVLDGELGDRAQLAAVVDIDPTQRDALAEKHGVPGLDSVDAALARDDVEGIAVCVPSGTHADVALRALDAGRHVIIEKPVDVTVEKAEPLIAARDRAGKAVTVISQRRFTAAGTAIHSAISDGRFGKLTSGMATLPAWRSDSYYASAGWRATWELDGGGALMNQAIHTIDLLIWFLGEPVEVHAFCDTLAHPSIEVEDTAAAAVRFGNGALAVIHGTTAAYPGATLRVGVYGDRGCAEMKDTELDFFHVADLESEVETGQADQTDAILAVGAAGDAEGLNPAADPAAVGHAGHRHQYLDLLDAVEQGRQPLVTVEEAIKPVALIQAIYESGRTGRTVRL